MPPNRAGALRHSETVLQRLRRLHPQVIDLSLDRIENLLARLEHPERRLAPVVHVAGTNGKGSLIAYLRAMLEAAGKRVQAYTSPHLVSFHERVRLTGGLISEEKLIEVFERCEAANGSDPITEFEITTAAAFLAFAEDAADVLLLETGLGGRLDATNVVERPRLCVITPVSIDHVQYLGDSLEKIAFEKAGILKPGVSAVVGPQPGAALQVIEARAADVGAPLFRHGADWQFAASGKGFSFAAEGRSQSFPEPNLPGEHQRSNAALAVACATRLADFSLNESAIATGLQQADWPGRLQRLTRGPLVDLLPKEAGWEIWLDGGHNASAGEMLARHLAAWQDRPTHLIAGMLNSKAASDYLRPLAAGAAGLMTIAIPDELNSLSAEELAAAAGEAGAAAEAQPSLQAAVETILAAQPPGRILIAGSLYLAGHVLREHG